MSKVVTLAIVGAGARGRGYASFAKAHPELLKVVAVAEPDDYYRSFMAEEYDIAPEKCFKSWDEFVAFPKMCDAVAICTQDSMHAAPAIACAELGYHILLEKPMAPTADECRKIVDAVKKAGVIFAVCHVLRYTKHTEMLQKIIESCEIGEIVSIQHLEPVGYWHQAHSYVRGLWRNEDQSSFMLLAKSCHDIDWIRGIMGKKCVAVQSFGSLRHFKESEKPAGAAEYCLDCPARIESQCPYSAVKIYFRDRFCKGEKLWPVNVLTPEPSPESLEKALREGNYGRCVYSCDNDVVDNQVVNMSFEDGSTASMTMTAFNFNGGRKTRIFGTRGEIDSNSKVITVRNFLDDSERVVDTRVANDGGILSGHGGGDMGLMNNFVQAVSKNDPTLIATGVDETLESHLIVFAAEESRKKEIICRI